MIYIEGFVAAVPRANKEAYRNHAAGAVPLFREFGVTRLVETWDDDVPEGKVTDFRRAVKAEDDEAIVFSWFEFPSRDVRDVAFKKMMDDPRMREMGASMPFDGKRMIMGGFAPVVDEGPGGAMGYVGGFVLAVPVANKEAYRRMAAEAAPVFLEHGASRVVECWGDDVPRGEITDFWRAVKTEDGENVAFAWIEWPSKAAMERGMKKVMEDPRLGEPADAPFDGQRMIHGGFAMLVDE
jgi:uncharacterized protein YbaA (DUF1428 family)